MPDPAGMLQRLALSRTLWLVVAWPLVGLAWQVLVARPHIGRSRDAGEVLRRLAAARVAGVGTVALAATALLGHLFLLLRLPRGMRVLFEPLAAGSRVPSLDAGTALLLDTRALMACGLACVVTLAAAVVLALRPAPERGWRPWAWLQLALAGALLSFLADGFVALAFGWTLAAGAGAWLAGWRDPRAGVSSAARGAVAVAALLLAAALLRGGLGGSWDGDGFPVASTSADSADVADVADVALSFHGLDGALTSREVDGARGATEAVLGRELLEQRVGPGGIGVVPAVLLVLLGAITAISAAPPPVFAPRALAAVALGASSSAIGPFLLIRLAWLLPSAQHAGLVVASVGAAILLGTVWSALGQVGARRWLLFAGGAPSGLTCVALGSGGVVPAMGVLVTSGGIAALAHLALVRGSAGDDLAPEPPPGDARNDGLLVQLAGSLGATFESMERWVVDAAVSAAAASVRIAAWVAAAVDDQLVAVPGDVAARHVASASGRVAPWLGISLSAVVWVLLTAAAVATLLRALWPGI
jgi:hypothetical protein